jgi:hypothetical protein
MTPLRAILTTFYRWRISRIERQLAELQRQRSAVDGSKAEVVRITREFEERAITLAILEHRLSVCGVSGGDEASNERVDGSSRRQARETETMRPAIVAAGKPFGSTKWRLILVGVALVACAVVAMLLRNHTPPSAEEWLRGEEQECARARDALVQAEARGHGTSSYREAVREKCAGLRP